MRMNPLQHLIVICASLIGTTQCFVPMPKFCGAIHRSSYNVHMSETLTVTESSPTESSPPTELATTSTTTPSKPKKNVKKNNKKRKSKPEQKNGKITNSAEKPKPKGKKKKYSSKKTAVKRSSKIPIRKLRLGSTIVGTIKQIVPYGAFVETKYAIGGNGFALIHKSQIRNELVKDVNDVLEAGQTVKARVIAINYDKGEVALSTRPKRTPRKPVSEISVGDEFTGRVKEIKEFGAFVDIGYVRDALLHISRITMDKVDDINDHLKQGQEVTVHIIDVDTEKNILAASMLNKVADAYLDRRRKNKP